MRSVYLPAAMIAFALSALDSVNGQETPEILGEKLCHFMYSSANSCYQIGKRDGSSICVSIAHITAQAMAEATGQPLFVFLSEVACLVGCAAAKETGSVPFSSAIAYDQFKEVICP